MARALLCWVFASMCLLVLPWLRPRNCSAAFFRHLAKTGGSTVQAVFRRNEQTGGFFYGAWGTWVEIRPPEWNLLFHEIKSDPDGFIARHPRLLVSFHKQTANQFPPKYVDFSVGRDRNFHIWEDLEELRAIYRSRGCGFVLATMLRRPRDLYVSDYIFEGQQSRRSFADFMGRDIQSASLLGWPHGWNSKAALSSSQQGALRRMLAGFDVVGLTERFDETLLLIAREAGIVHAMYRRMNAAGSAYPRPKGAKPNSAREVLHADPAVAAATANLTAVDGPVYEEVRARFEARLAAEPPEFHAAVRAFQRATERSAEEPAASKTAAVQLPGLPGVTATERSSVGHARYVWVGGAPPRDLVMVTTELRYRCKPSSPFAKPGQRSDYGSCDVRLGKPADPKRGLPPGPQRLDELKTLVPCERINCTKVAADQLACSHRRAAQPSLRICPDIESPPDGFL